MKRLLISMLLLLLLISFSACGLLADNTSEGTQQNDSLQNEELSSENSGTEQQTDNQAGEAASNGSQTESASNAKTIKVTLFFPSEDNSALKKEDRDIQVVDGAILKSCILSLAEGPKTEGLRNPIPEGTKLLGISIKDKVATVDFSNEFLKTNGSIAEITTRLSVVNTLTGISGIEKVRLHIDGEEMIGPSGMPLGEMGPAMLDANGNPLAGEEKSITLYFSDSNAEYVVGEKRVSVLTENSSIEEMVLTELIKGPVSEDLWSAIPEGTKLISASTKNGLCTVDFSKEFVDNSPGGTASERMVISSVVNTLTELEGVQKVQFLIDGKKREIYTHAVFDKPFSRAEEVIAK